MTNNIIECSIRELIELAKAINHRISELQRKESQKKQTEPELEEKPKKLAKINSKNDNKTQNLITSNRFTPLEEEMDTETMNKKKRTYNQTQSEQEIEQVIAQDASNNTPIILRNKEKWTTVCTTPKNQLHKNDYYQRRDPHSPTD